MARELESELRKEQVDDKKIAGNPLVIAAIVAAAGSTGALAYHERERVKGLLKNLQAAGLERRLLEVLHSTFDSGESDTSLTRRFMSGAFSALTGGGRRLSPRNLYFLHSLARKTGDDIRGLSPSVAALAEEFGINSEVLRSAEKQADIMPLWLNSELRKALIKRGYCAVPVIEGQKGWEEVERIKIESWPSKSLREYRHKGNYPQSYLAITKDGIRGEITGYLSYMALDGFDLNTDLGNFSFEDALNIQAQVPNFQSLKGKTIMLTGSGTRGTKGSLDPAPVYAAMCAILDLARENEALVIVPALSLKAVEQQFKNGGDYADYWFGDDGWRQALSLFGVEGPVNPTFMRFKTPVAEIVDMLGKEGTLRIASDGSSVGFPTKDFGGRKIVDTKRSPVPIYIEHGGEGRVKYTCEVPCGWLIFDSALGIGLGHKESLLRGRLPLIE